MKEETADPPEACACGGDEESQKGNEQAAVSPAQCQRGPIYVTA